MRGKLVYLALLIVGFLGIHNFYPVLASIVVGLCFYFYIRAFSSDFTNHRNLASVILKLWSLVTLIFLLWKFFFLMCRNFLCYKRTLRKWKPHVREHCKEQLSVEKEIDVIVVRVSEHYIHPWYQGVGPNPEFILLLNSLIKWTLLRLCSKLANLNRYKLLYVALQVYNHLFLHLMAVKTIKLKEADEVKHWAMQDKVIEWCYLQSLLSAVIDTLVHPRNQNAVHSKHSPIIHNLIVEILTEHLLYPLLNLLSDPVTLNSWLLKVLESYNEENYSSWKVKPKEYLHGCFSSPVYSCGPAIVFQSKSSQPDQNVIQSTVPEGGRINHTISNQFNQESKYAVNQKCHLKKKNDESLSVFVSFNAKSSSSFNLFDEDSIRDRSSKSEGGSPASYSASSMKRSKSADFICQIPHLKALSIRDYNSLLQNKDKTFLAFKSDSTSDSNIELAEEAIEFPALFSDVRICDTMQASEDGISLYTLYCIKYLGLYHDAERSSEKPQFIKQEVNIRRRFREFIYLHSRLEDNPTMKNALKGIKGPSKWLALPFSNMDKKYIAERRSFLENYLKEVCNQVSIAQSAELQEFLAYGGNTTAAFVKRAGEITVPRIDKIFVRGVKGAIDMFKTALPNSVEIGSTLDPALKSYSEDPIIEHGFPEHLLEYSVREPEIRFLLKQMLLSSSWLHTGPQRKFDENFSIWRNLFQLKAQNSCQCFDTWPLSDKSFESEENTLGTSVVDLFIESLKLRKINNSHLFSILRFLISPSINRFLNSMADELTEENLALFLHVLHESLWSGPSDTSGVIDDLKHICSYDRLKQSLKVFIKKVTCFPFLQSWIEEHTHLFLSAIQSPELNRCFLFHLFDILVQELCSGGCYL